MRSRPRVKYRTTCDRGSLHRPGPQWRARKVAPHHQPVGCCRAMPSKERWAGKPPFLRLKNSSREEFGSGGWSSITSAHRVRSWPASDRAMTIAWRASGTRRGRFIGRSPKAAMAVNNAGRGTWPDFFGRCESEVRAGAIGWATRQAEPPARPYRRCHNSLAHGQRSLIPGS